MSNITNERTAVMSYLINSGSVIEMSVGAVINGFCKKDVIVVKGACARVVREIVTTFNMVSLTEQGLMIPVTES